MKSNQRKAMFAKMNARYDATRFRARRTESGGYYYSKGLHKTDKKYLGVPVYKDNSGKYYVKEVGGFQRIRVHPKFKKKGSRG